jgi:hypothetical protein
MQISFMKKWHVIVILLATFIGYLIPYGIMKIRCSSTSYTPSDPWKGPYPQTRLYSNITYWGVWIDHGREPEISSAEIKMSYRDPGYRISSRSKQVLNWIYFPLQKVDEHLFGWAVRFRDRIP